MPHTGIERQSLGDGEEFDPFKVYSEPAAEEKVPGLSSIHDPETDPAMAERAREIIGRVVDIIVRDFILELQKSGTTEEEYINNAAEFRILLEKLAKDDILNSKVVKAMTSRRFDIKQIQDAIRDYLMKKVQETEAMKVE